MLLYCLAFVGCISVGDFCVEDTIGVLMVDAPGILVLMRRCRNTFLLSDIRMKMLVSNVLKG